MLTKFQFHCSITCRNIIYFVFWLPYCHTLWHHQYLICIIQKLWISLERYEIWQKWKYHSSSLLKVFQIHLFFNTSIFHFIGTLIIALFFIQNISSFLKEFRHTFFVFPLTKYSTTLSPAGCTFDVIGSIIFGGLHFWRHWLNMAKILTKYGEQRLVMVNYACGFNQSETRKYFERIIIRYSRINLFSLFRR